MLSRVANSIYWMSRYMERVENIARFVDVNLHLTLDLPTGPVEQWGPLVTATGDAEPFKERYGEPTRENVIQFLTFDTKNPNSVLSCLRTARENARSVREIIPSRMFEQVNWAYLFVKESSDEGWVADTPHLFFSEVRRASQLFIGIMDASMMRDEAWNFCRLGRMLERADKTSRLLDVKYFVLLPKVSDVGTTYDDLQWAAVLQSTSAFEMYHKCYPLLSPPNILEFLLLNKQFPRSIHHCLIRADESLHDLSGTPEGSFSNRAEQRLGQLRSELAYTQVEDIIVQGVHEFIDSFQTKLNRVGEEIYNTFFAMRPLAGSYFNRRGYASDQQ